MPSPAALSSYNLQRGKLLAHIYLFDEFYPTCTSKERVKNKRRNDVDRLKEALEERNFEVHVEGSSNGMGGEELRRSLKKVARNTEEAACLMIFIVACDQPGSGAKAVRGSFTFADVLESFMEFNCSTALKGKPKLIFIQNDVGVIQDTVVKYGNTTRQANEYPVTFDSHVFVGYFERNEDREPSMASVFVQEIQKGKTRTINNVLTGIVARKCWSKTPKFSSTLTDNFCVPDPLPPSERKIQQNSVIVIGSKNSDDPQSRLRRELDLYRDAKREVALRKKNLQMMGYHFEGGYGDDYDEDDDWDRYGRRGKYMRSDLYNFGRLVESARSLNPFRPSDREIEKLYLDRGLRDTGVMHWGSRPYVRREPEPERLRSKCAPEDKKDVEVEAAAEKAKEEKKEEEKNKELEPLDDSQPVEEDRHGDMLLALACTAGHISFQSSKGSVFIKSVCDALTKCGNDEDILNVISVAVNRIALDIDVSGSKQMPTFTSSLRKQVTLGVESVPISA